MVIKDKMDVINTRLRIKPGRDPLLVLLRVENKLTGIEKMSMMPYI